MKAVSLFSGIGGFDLAMQRNGIEVVATCDNDKNCLNILNRHFPDAEKFNNVRKIGKKTHGRNTIDLICGGFPCQDLSIAGKREGLTGERSGLWFEFARIIDELEPGWVVVENVPGLLSSSQGSDFAIIIQWLAKRGYCVAWRVLDAQYFGVAQRRRRVFVVASFGNGRAAEVLFEPESGKWDTPPSREAGKEVAYSLGANPSHSGDKGDGGINTTMIAFPIDTQNMTDGHKSGGLGFGEDGDPSFTLGVGHHHAVAFTRQRSDEYQEGDIVSTISQRDYKSASDLVSTGWDTQRMRINDADGIAPTLSQSDGKGGQRAPLVAWEMQHASEAYRETEGGIAPTLQSRMGTGGNNVPMVGVRRLTPLECERLQGFKDGWTDGQSDSVRYKQLGNAVAVPVVEWIIKRIVEVEAENE